MPNWLSTAQTLVIAAVAIASFHVAYQWEAAGVVVAIYLAGMFSLAWVRTTRWAFYLGMVIGFLIAAPQLHFFAGIFGFAAVPLWLIFGLWLGFYLLLARLVVERWPRFGALWIPVLWLALELFRSELYYLRFAWLTPGFAMSHPTWLPYVGVGVYGFSFVTLMCMALIRVTKRRAQMAAVGAALLWLVVPPLIPPISPAGGLQVVGIQLEGATVAEQLSALDRASREHPDAELFVLSEYSFDASVPSSIIAWCRQNEKHLIAGGKDYVDDGSLYYNTAFVVSSAGEIVFKQAKSVPIQFFKDGLPAETQGVWESPWGKIGIAICYDLSYSRVMDRLVRSGAQALIIPTMDAVSWGAHEHVLHTRIAPVRAREYGLAIIRVASSGISQIVNVDGRVTATAPFPGQGEQIVGELPIATAGRLPWDRFVVLPAVVAVAALLLYLGVTKLIASVEPNTNSTSPA